VAVTDLRRFATEHETAKIWARMTMKEALQTSWVDRLLNFKNHNMGKLQDKVNKRILNNGK
jgi:hypothetical protein